MVVAIEVASDETVVVRRVEQILNFVFVCTTMRNVDGNDIYLA